MNFRKHLILTYSSREEDFEDCQSLFEHYELDFMVKKHWNDVLREVKRSEPSILIIDDVLPEELQKAPKEKLVQSVNALKLQSMVENIRSSFSVLLMPIIYINRSACVPQQFCALWEEINEIHHYPFNTLELLSRIKVNVNHHDHFKYSQLEREKTRIKSAIKICNNEIRLPLQTTLDMMKESELLEMNHILSCYKTMEKICKIIQRLGREMQRANYGQKRDAA